MTETSTSVIELFDNYAEDDDIVALHLRQRLLPVEEESAIVFPPTYAGMGYAIDSTIDGNVVQIDSVGSQANRIEPLFKKLPLADLVPQITIEVGDRAVSIFDVGHRIGDALVRASDGAQEANDAFRAYQGGNASRIARLAPTSLVFGAWDSRETGAKLPRILQSVVRAWNVDELRHRGATYIPPVDYASEELLGAHAGDKAEKDARSELGFQHAPAEGLGGVRVRGGIYRDTTVNLVAIRCLDGADGCGTNLRRYILGLGLVAACSPMETFLRQGCLLTADAEGDHEGWMMVRRNGQREPIALTFTDALNYARRTAREFGVGDSRAWKFLKAAAQQMIRDKKKRKE